MQPVLNRVREWWNEIVATGGDQKMLIEFLKDVGELLDLVEQEPDAIPQTYEIRLRDQFAVRIMESNPDLTPEDVWSTADAFMQARGSNQ